jgi:hydroxymethylbilane synthase
MRLRLASRGSELALWQARHVEQRVRAAIPAVQVELVIVRTTGDRIADVPLARIGDTGLFSKEIDLAVLEGLADAAVHSLKDVPTEDAPGLAIAAVLQREDPRDAYLPAHGRARRLDTLPTGARVGTSSLRRRCLLLSRRPDLVVEDLRGNLDTRLEQLRRGDYDAAILALAGVRRLGREDAVAEVLDAPAWLPAAGQGALAVVTRADDASTLAAMAALDHEKTRKEVIAERTLLRRLHGGCQIPIGALASVTGGSLRLDGFAGSVDGREVVRGWITGDATDPVALGEALARTLEEKGARAIIDEVRRMTTAALPRASAP